MKALSLKAVGMRVRNCREQFGLSREQFSEQVRISPQFLAEIENGKKGMSAETLYKLCTRFQLSADYILMGQTGAALGDPISTLLAEMPPQARALAEDILQVIHKTAVKESSGQA